MQVAVPITDAERPGLLARIYAKSVEEGACLIWRGCFSDSGVPQVSFRSRAHSVRRVLYEAVTGRAPGADMVVAPRCRNPQCVSPGCLRLLTVAQLRKIDAARGAFSGANANAARLAAARRRAEIPDDVIALVRSVEGTSAQAAAASGVSLSYCKQIRAGKARVPLASPWKGLI